MPLFSVIINISILFVFPMFLLIRLIRKKQAVPFNLVLEWLFVTLLITYFYQGAFWPAGSGYYTRYVSVIALMACTGFLIFKFSKMEKVSLKGWGLVTSFFNLFLVSLVCIGLYTVSQGKFRPDKGVELSFPLKGKRFYIAHGGCNELVNHHCNTVPAQHFAIDVCQLTSIGLRGDSLIDIANLNSYPIFGRELYSPCSGTIVDVANHFPDQIPPKRDPNNPYGNFLAILKKDDGAVIILAHLKQGSILKNIGDEVKEGEFLAQIGNSGNTSEPHLHIHAVEENSDDYFFQGKGVPMFFESNFYVRNDLVHKD